MRYGVLFMLCAAAVIAYVQRAALSVPSKTIQGDLGIDATLMGVVLGGWYAGYALGQLPSGWLADRWGSRHALALFALAWSLITGLTALAANVWLLLPLWFLMGLAQAGIFPCATKAIGAWFPESMRAFASGLLGAAMALGSALAPRLTGDLLEYLPWPSILALYMLPGLAWAALFYLLMPEAPTRRSAPRAAPAPATAIAAGLPAKSSAPYLAHAPEPAEPAPPRVDWTRLLTSGPMQLLCAQQFLRAAAMAFFFVWFPRFLQETRGVTETEAGRLAAWPGVGGLVGGLLGGFASDLVLHLTGNLRLARQGIAVLGMSGAALLALAAHFAPTAERAVFLLSLAAFSGTFGGISGYTVAIQFGGRRIATVFSLMNMCGNIGAMLFPPVVGWLAQRYGRWDLALILFVVIFALDAVCWALLNPRGTLFEEPPS